MWTIGTGVNPVASEIALLMELKDDTTTLENSRSFGGFFPNAKHTLTIQCGRLLSFVFTQMSWNLIFTQKCAYKFLWQLYHFQNLEATKVFFSSWMGKLRYWVGQKVVIIFADSGILFSAKKKWAIRSWKDMDEP